MGDYIEVAFVGELKSGEAKLIEINGREIALFNCEGKYYAVDNDCTHVGGPLCDGEVCGTTVTCPWHGAEFDLKSGQALAPAAEKDINTYNVHVDGDIIKIEI